MTQTDPRSLQQIKRETEQTRAGLTNTVEQLKTSVADTAADIRHRLNPDTIKTEVSGYIRSRGEQLLNDVSESARKNPMQAVAVGASLAYPLFRLARSVPLPVLMVGAGLFFAGSKTGQAITQKASNVAADLSGEVVQRAHNFSERAAGQAKRTADQAGSTIATGSRTLQDQATSFGGDLADRASGLKDQGARFAENAAAAIQDRVATIGDTLTNRAGDLRDEGARIAGAAAATVHGMASSATSAARDAVSASADAGMDAARAVGHTASDYADRAGRTVLQTIEQNPLLVAGVGLLLGGLIASALPRTDLEDDMIGDASKAVKQKAEAAASQGFEAAKGIVGEVYDDVTRKVETEGLTAEGLGKAAQDIGQRVRRVAEAAVTTAFEPEQASSKSNGGNDHV